MEDLDKIKIANISNMKFSVMDCKTSLMLLNKINVLLLALIYRRKSVGSNKGKERCRFGNYLQKEELKVNLTFL